MRTSPKTLYLRIKPETSSEPLPENALPYRWNLKLLSLRKEQREFYDTFEWHAFLKDFAIVKKKRVLSLVELDTGHETASVPFSGKGRSFFADSLAPCNLKKQLSLCSNIRAFTKICSLTAVVRSYQILDSNEKTIAILTSELLSLSETSSGKPFAHIASLTPLKGYEEMMELAEKSLSSHHEVDTAFGFRELFLLIISTAGQTAGGYSAKINITLEPDAPIHTTTRLLMQFTLSVMRRNENGIRGDIDTEFLHDYRVAIRRTHSLLKQLKGVFDTADTAYYLRHFRDLGKRTNALRDLDVALLRQTTYSSYLPPSLRPPLELFFSDIAASRRALHKQLKRYLSSGNYRSFLEKWEKFITQESLPDASLTTESSRSTIIVARSTIKKAWKKVIRHGRLISQEATDAELHALRIDCKRLRYLLELFQPIFPHKTTAPVIKKLKVLQDELGDFVDLAVQRRFLDEKLALIPAKNGEDKLLAAATGGLMATLFQKQEKAREKFHRTFNSFDHEESSQLFHHLLTGTARQ